MRAPVLVLSLVLALSAQAQWREPLEGGRPGRLAGGTPALRDESVTLIVRFKKPAMGMTANAVASRRAALEERVTGLRRDLDGVEIARKYHRVLFGASVRVKREQRDAVAALPYVASVYEERKLTPLVTESAKHIRADKVWTNPGTRGKGVVVAVIDSGIDYNHIALGEGFGEGHKVIGGWDFVDNDADPMDLYGHGTYVAGIIAGNGGGLLGIAPEASLLAFRALVGAFGYESDILEAVERTVDPNQDGDTSDHADIANMSLGGIARENDALAEAVENATAAGVLFCIAAGNGGDYGNILTPAIAPSAITVGASDDDDAMADFSSRGPSWDFGIKPEIVAPGVKIHSAYPHGDWRESQGTSAAAPHIAGVAALVKSLHRDWTPAEIKSAIVSTSVLLDQDVMIAGAGRVDALNAVSTATLVSPPFVSFGQTNPRDAVWSRTKPVRLRNLASSAKTLSANVRGLREGVAVRVTPSEVTLGAGEETSVTIEVTVTNKDVPVPLEGTLSYGGSIEWTGGEVPVHVPWAFVKGTFIRVESPDSSEELGASVLSATKKWNGFGFYGSWRQFWPYETVDIVLTQYPSSRTAWITKHVFAEQVDLTTNTNLVMPIANAKYTIGAETLDEKGETLTAPEGFCHEAFVLAFANGRKFSFAQIPESRHLLGTFSDRVKVHTLHTCADLPRTTLYTALHEPFNGLSESVTHSMQPNWLRQDVSFAVRDSHMTTAVALMRFPGPEGSYYLDGGQFFLMRPTTAQLTMYYTASPVPEMDLVTIVNRWGLCNDPRLHPEAECELLGDVFLYMNGTDVRVDKDVFLDVSPMAYRVPTGTPLLLGTAPAWPQVGFSRGAEYWDAYTTWIGALGERRSEDTRRGFTVVRDANGTVVGDNTKGAVGGQRVLPHGAYTIESVDESYKIAGANGKATVNVSLDTRRSDPMYPIFTGLRIVDAGERQVSVIDRDASASLLFSIADIVTRYDKRFPPREEATRVEYRLAGATEWRPLTAVVEARQYQNNSFLFGGTGTKWRADLSPTTRGFTGFVDLRIHAEDHEGNEVTLRLEPAFFVGQDVRRRATRH